MIACVLVCLQPERIAARTEEIRDLIEDTKSDYEKEKLSERLARLAGGVAVLKVNTSLC